MEASSAFEQQSELAQKRSLVNMSTGGLGEIPKDPPYVNLTLEGGGVLGIAYCGALEQLHKRDLLRGITNFAGTSAGSIFAGALACGATFNFMLIEMSHVNFADFIDYGNKAKAAYNIYYYNGACPGNYFITWYGSVIQKLTGNPNITLKQVHDRYGGRLVIAATDLNRRKIIYIDWKSFPDMPLCLAVRASMSIPGIFIPVKYLDYYFVDGGVLDNYPISVFHNQTGDVDRINPKTLGLMLLTTNELRTFPQVDGMTTYLESLAYCYMTQTQKMYMDEQDWKRTIKIDCGGVSSMNFDIDNKAKMDLVERGRLGVINHFSKPTLSQRDIALSAEKIISGLPREVVSREVVSREVVSRELSQPSDQYTVAYPVSTPIPIKVANYTNYINPIIPNARTIDSFEEELKILDKKIKA